MTIVAVGRIKASYAKEGCEEFLGRLRRFSKVEHIEVRDVRRGRGGQVDTWKEAEGEALLKQVPRGALTVALHEHGKQWKSTELAQWIDGQQTAGVSSIAFLLGGPDGHSQNLLSKVDKTWSLGKLTLPHELARLVLAEQLYRAVSMLAGHPYHRE
jgi:23S rRNA (pseudouridine1915-N3)-methyltransferase